MRVLDEDGDMFDGGASEPIEVGFVLGFGQLLPHLEQRLRGLPTGAHRKFKLSPEQCYGPHDPDAVFEVGRDELPPDVALDDELVLEDADGEDFTVRVTKVTDDAVLLDGNHPLAGETLIFEVKVELIRPPTSVELQQAKKAKEAMLAAIAPAAEPLVQLRRKPVETRS